MLNYFIQIWAEKLILKVRKRSFSEFICEEIWKKLSTKYQSYPKSTKIYAIEQKICKCHSPTDDSQENVPTLWLTSCNERLVQRWVDNKHHCGVSSNSWSRFNDVRTFRGAVEITQFTFTRLEREGILAWKKENKPN